MNQEFQRQIVKKLLWLSDYIISERDDKSDNYWQKHMTFIFGRVQKMTELLEDAKGLKSPGLLTKELYIDPWLMRQHIVALQLRSDPFVPKQIRERIAEVYFDRVGKMSDSYLQIMNRFCKDLYSGKVKDENLELKIQTWVKLGESYFKKGWGWEKAEKRIVEMRGEIETYLINLK